MGHLNRTDARFVVRLLVFFHLLKLKEICATLSSIKTDERVKGEERLLCDDIPGVVD